MAMSTTALRALSDTLMDEVMWLMRTAFNPCLWGWIMSVMFGPRGGHEEHLGTSRQAYLALPCVAGLCEAFVFRLGSDELLLDVTIESMICHGMSL